MNKRLVYINSICILLTTAVYIFGYYMMNYPMRFDLLYIIQECSLEYLAVIFAITALVSYLISSLNFKESDFKSKFLRVFPIINILVTLFLTYQSTEVFLNTQKEIVQRENHYLQQAEKDIKNDKVTIQYAGGLSLPAFNTETIQLIDRIRGKYGVTYKNTGCIIDPIDQKAQEKYTAAVNPYLEKRNGKGWELRMQKEIDQFISDQ